MIHPVPCCCDRAPEIVIGTRTTWYVSVHDSALTGSQLRKLERTDGSPITASTFNLAGGVQSVCGDKFFWMAPGGGIAIRQFQFDGTQDWLYTDAVMLNGSRYAAIDADGNSYFCGNEPVGNLRHFRAVKVDNTGSLVWSYSKTDPGPDTFDHVGFNSSGSNDGWASLSRIGTVHFSSQFGGTQEAEFELDIDGNEIWSSFGTLTAGVMCIHDADGNVIVSGNSPDGTHSYTIYDTAGAVVDRILTVDTPGTGSGMIEWSAGKLYIISVDSVTQLTVRQLSGASYGTTDWVHTITVVSPNVISVRPRIAVDTAGDVYITYGTVISSVNVANWKKLSASDGSEVYANSVSSRQAGWPMLTPGRSPILI